MLVAFTETMKHLFNGSRITHHTKLSTSITSQRLFISNNTTSIKQSLFTIPSDKPYRQLLVADSKYFFIRFQNETNTDFSKINIDNEHYQDLDNNVYSTKASWYKQRGNQINGGYFYIFSENTNHINHARNLLNKFCQNIELFELPNPRCIHAIIGESGSNRLKLMEQCNVSLFVDMTKPTQLWIVSKNLNHSSNQQKKCKERRTECHQQTNQTLSTQNRAQILLLHFQKRSILQSEARCVGHL